MINDTTKALALDNSNFEALSNRGVGYAFKKNYDYAIIDFKKAIELNPQVAISYFHLALTYKALGKYCEGLENFERFYSLANSNNPDDIPALSSIKNEIQNTKSHCLNILRTPSNEK